jgi:hypothetical protein
MKVTYSFAGPPKAVKFIAPKKGKTQYGVSLEFRETERRSFVEFEMEPGHLMALMRGLQKLQAERKIPIPPNLRPKGKPALRVVTDAEPS